MQTLRAHPFVALLALLPCSAGLRAEPFSQMLESGGVRFEVKSANDASIGTLRIAHTGLAPGRVHLEREIDGIVSGAELGDLDADGRPELYVYTTSAGSGSYGDVITYAVTSGGGLAQIGLPQLTEEEVLGWGYSGHDRFRLEGRHLRRSFPVYRAGDTNAAPGGGTRELRYRLITEGSAPVLVPETDDGN
jgi:hypothetical protein